MKSSEPTTPRPTPTGSPGHDWYYDMSQNVHEQNSCDYATGTLLLRDQLKNVRDGKGQRAAAVVRLVSYGKPRWNTPSGRRPSQRQTETMTEWPGIYTPVNLRIERVLAGLLEGEMVTGYARAGEIGGDTFFSCVFSTSKVPFRLWDEESTAAIGGRYLAFFGPEIVTGVRNGAVRMPELVEFLEVRGNTFINEGESTPQPLDE